LKKNPQKTFQEGFDFASKRNVFGNAWDEEFGKLINEIDQKKINIIVIDKNYPPDTLKKFR